MKCAERRGDGGGWCRREAIAAVSGGHLITAMCGDCTVRALRLVPGLSVRWFADRLARRRPGRASRAS